MLSFPFPISGFDFCQSSCAPLCFFKLSIQLTDMILAPIQCLLILLFESPIQTLLLFQLLVGTFELICHS